MKKRRRRDRRDRRKPWQKRKQKRGEERRELCYVCTLRESKGHYRGIASQLSSSSLSFSILFFISFSLSLVFDSDCYTDKRQKRIIIKHFFFLTIAKATNTKKERGKIPSPIQTKLFFQKNFQING